MLTERTFLQFGLQRHDGLRSSLIRSFNRHGILTTIPFENLTIRTLLEQAPYLFYNTNGLTTKQCVESEKTIAGERIYFTRPWGKYEESDTLIDRRPLLRSLPEISKEGVRFRAATSAEIALTIHDFYTVTGELLLQDMFAFGGEEMTIWHQRVGLVEPRTWFALGNQRKKDGALELLPITDPQKHPQLQVFVVAEPKYHGVL